MPGLAVCCGWWQPPSGLRAVDWRGAACGRRARAAGAVPGAGRRGTGMRAGRRGCGTWAPGLARGREAGVFALYVLLGGGSPPFSEQVLARELGRHFSTDGRVTVSLRPLPFGGRRQVALSWPSWRVSAYYEEGGRVAEDSAEIQRRLGAAAPADLSRTRRRIRAVFDDDDGGDHVNEAVEVFRFLTAIPGAVVFDPQQNDIMRA